jgi:phosphohistidine phosphatase
VKHLFILRHGKSDWDAEYEGDHERPLSKRGRKSAQLMGTYLSSVGQKPQLVLASSAVRARTTAELAGEAGGWTCPQEVRPELYGASTADVLRCVAAQHDRVTRLLVVGHEPTLSEFIGEMIGGGNVCVPTAALACIELDADKWRRVRFGTGVLQWLILPRGLAAFVEG